LEKGLEEEEEEKRFLKLKSLRTAVRKPKKLGCFKDERKHM
jgi:hypothetical protein